MAGSAPPALQGLLDDLPRAHPAWMREAVSQLPGSSEDKTAALLALLERQQDDLARAYVGAGLLYLGHPEGKASFLGGLRSDHPGWRELSLLQLPDLRGPARAGEAKLRIPDEEVLAAVAPLLADPTSNAGGRALAFALQSRPAVAAPYVAHLLRHPELRIQDEVLKALLGRGQDSGALQLLEEELLEPGLSARRGDEPWRRFRWSQCPLLPACARNTSDPALSRRVGQLVLRVLQETLGAPDRGERLNQSSAEPTATGWLDARHLLAAIVQTRPAGTQALLERILDDAQLPIRLRSYALIAQAQLGYRPVPQAADIVAEMFLSRPGGQQEDRVALLLQYGLIDLERIAAELPRQDPEGWFDVLVAELQERASGTDAKRIAAILIEVSALEASRAAAALAPAPAPVPVAVQAQARPKRPWWKFW